MPSAIHAGGPPRMSVDQLRAAVLAGEVDTVIVAFTDMQGRLQGKRLHGHFFLEHVLDHGTEGCNYLLAVDVDMNTVAGYAISSWERGYGDMFFEMDLTTLRRTPGHPASVTIQSDLTWLDGSGEVAQSPRSILRRQVEAAEADGYAAYAGTELEFILFEDSYESAWDRRYQDLTGANRYNVDYSILGGSKVEPVLREIRNEMYAAGMTVESAKGECNLGQHEIGFLFDDVLRTCDNHSVYKTGAKEIAARHGQSLTFMAKFDEREGNSCHIHLSLRGTDGEVVFADDERDGGRSELMDQFMAGMLATMSAHLLLCPEHQLLQAFCGRFLRPDRGGLGQRQPHLQPARRRPRAGAARREPGARRRRQPLPRGRRDDGRRAARHPAGAGAAAGVRGERLRRRLRARAHHPGRGTGPPRGQRRRPRGLRRRRRRPLRQRRGRRARGLQRRGDRLGAGPRLREAVTHRP